MSRAIGVLLAALVLLTMPLASACYAPRVESCRDPMSDFSSFSGVAITNPHREFAFESGSASVELEITAATTLPSGDRCVAVRSELRDASGGLVEVLDTPIRAHVNSGILTTTPIFHYHSSQLTPMTVHVTALGATMDATVIDPAFVDAGFTPFSDGGVDAGPRPIDANVLDTGITSDAGVIDADVDASMTDAADVDAGL